MRSTVMGLLVGGILLLVATVLWWRTGPLVQHLLPQNAMPPFDPRAFWVSGSVMALATSLWLISRLTRRRADDVECTVAGVAHPEAPSASTTPQAAATKAEPNLQTVQQDASRLGMTLHTMRAGYVLREANGRELVYADLRLLASALSRHAAR